MGGLSYVTLSRDCVATQIPSGEKMKIEKGEKVRITQSLGGTFTVMTDQGFMARIEGKDADALGIEVKNQMNAVEPVDATRESVEKSVWDQLKTCFDPEIPVNIVDLGLIYECQVTPIENGFKVFVKMTLTAPGCGMGPVLRGDVEQKLISLPNVKAVEVDLVFDPPWDQSQMSEAARLQLGFF